MKPRFRIDCRALSCLLFALLGCADGHGSTAPPNVLLIVVDTLRPDRLGSYGNERGLTPFLDELAAKGVVLTHAYAASSWTRPSVASILTSRYPSQHGAVTIFHRIEEDELTIAEVFERLGYVTGAVSGSPIISAGSGFSQGFGQFSEFPWRDKVRVDRVQAETLRWLDSLDSASGKPGFLYLHLMEPHGPYAPPEPYRSRFRRGAEPAFKDANTNRRLMRAWSRFMKKGELEGFRDFTGSEVELLASLYDGEVASLDAELRGLFAELERRKFLDGAIVILTADHGEEFYEHGGTWHGYTLYNETIRVPLIVVAPGIANGTESDQNVSLVDVAPTLLELLHAPVPRAFEGRSFAARLRRGAWLRGFLPFAGGAEEEDTLAELERSGGHYTAVPKHTRALIRRSLKVLTEPGGGSESYDLSADPGELKPNPPALAEKSAALLQSLSERSAELAKRAHPAAETFELDAATKDRLRALGYAVDEAPGAD